MEGFVERGFSYYAGQAARDRSAWLTNGDGVADFVQPAKKGGGYCKSQAGVIGNKRESTCGFGCRIALAPLNPHYPSFTPD